jgi:hypothetical protein
VTWLGGNGVRLENHVIRHMGDIVGATSPGIGAFA